MIRNQLIVRGEVGEGGIRYFAQLTGSRLKLTGFAKRGTEGAILIEVQGLKENIDQFIEKLKAGNGFFKIDSIEIVSMDVNPNEKFFAIK